MRRKFKNLRRPAASESGSGSKRSREDAENRDGNNDANDDPCARQPKRAKSHTLFDVTEDEEDAYEQKISELHEEVEKDKPSKKKVSSLMKDTFTKRRQWITQDLPEVKEILEKFPPLKKARMVRTYFVYSSVAK